MVSIFIVTLALALQLRPLLLEALELDEALDFLLRGSTQPAELVDHLRVAHTLFEELADTDVECLKDSEQRVQTDLVLTLLHPGQIRLMDPDPVGELGLRQFPLTAKLPDLSTDEFYLAGPGHGYPLTFYATTQ